MIRKQAKPYTLDEMSFYDDIVYDEKGLNIGYENIPSMEKNVKVTGKTKNNAVISGQTSADVGIKYEKACAKYLNKIGYTNVRVTQASGDQGIDILAEKEGKTYGIQCKHYKAAVGNKAVQEAFSGAAYYGCDIAVVMTNSTFTQSAVELANRNGVLLWPGIESHTFIRMSQGCSRLLV